MSLRDRLELRLLTKREITEIVSSSDVVLEVLDARVPESLRNRFLEKTVERSGKRLVLVLNKRDLVPRDVVEEWLDYYRSAGLEVYATSVVWGELGGLGRLLQQFRRGRVYFSIFGAPKVGKSSLVNLLKKKSSATISRYPGTPGYTRHVQVYKITPSVYMIDTPGALSVDQDPLERAIRTCPPERIRNPVRTAGELLERILRESPMVIERDLGIGSRDPYEILRLYAIERGWFYEKDREPNIEEASIDIIRRYLDGRIRFYTRPPTRQALGETQREAKH